ncbi:AbrB/MazE/SpoVT family DNA-binding domain-containing protein [Halobacteria archaeon AArc-curdl1]|uniref:AbrB/MazE/SpoVT family DNA-binding domain-containing protein n=1 Tax=Natronosalvus hydrolyticus TaxID=2979988 RepID=A0AAP2ZBF8_9EURY|nr:AbrB/MazE/SpoVT family DNA-binding domain-containing protein [Halobacteria archaeon AArc-curdl1]
MTDDDDQLPWMNPALFTKQLQEAGEQMAQSQQDALSQLTGAGGMNPFDSSSAFGPMNLGTATFKARVQSGGRISIPEPERDALDIEEGDIVQTVVIPVKRSRDDE